jgi:hypothetical protein
VGSVCQTPAPLAVDAYVRRSRSRELNTARVVASSTPRPQFPPVLSWARHRACHITNPHCCRAPLPLLSPLHPQTHNRLQLSLSLLIPARHSHLPPQPHAWREQPRLGTWASSPLLPYKNLPRSPATSPLGATSTRGAHLPALVQPLRPQQRDSSLVLHGKNQVFICIGALSVAKIWVLPVKHPSWMTFDPISTEQFIFNHELGTIGPQCMEECSV